MDIRVLPGWRTADGTHMAGLQVTLQDGWKTYWRSPGDAGVPPQFDWRNSRNLAGVEITWPTPKQIKQGRVRTLGYSDILVLPLRVLPKKAGQPVTLSAEIDMGVCSNVCLPVTIKVSQDLPSTLDTPDPRIVAALAARPYSASEAGVQNVACRITPKQDGMHLRAEIELPSAGGNELAVIETDDPNIWVAQAKTSRAGGRLIAETDLYHSDGHAFALDRSGLRITVLGRKHSVDIQGCPAG